MSDLYRGLALHLKLDEFQNGEVIDVSGNGNDGTPQGRVKPVPDELFGSVLRFDGKTGHVEIPPLGETDALTIQAWVYLERLKGWQAIRNDQGWKKGYVHFQFLDGRLEFSVYGSNPGDQWFDYKFKTRTWYHLTVTYSPRDQRVKLYVDGQLQETKPYTSCVSARLVQAWVGGWNGGARFFKGRIANLRLYRRVLDEEEIRQNKQIDASRLVLHLKLDEIKNGQVGDDSGSGLVGTVQGDPTVITDEVFGRSLRLDGQGDYVTVPDSEALRIGPYTVAVWIKPEGAPNQTWKGIAGKPGRNYNIWLHKSGFIHHRFHSGADTNAGAPDTPPGSVPWDEWSHVAITNDGQTATTYVNGLALASGPTGGELGIDNTGLIVGRNLDGKAGSAFKGQIAHLRVYRGALPAEAIQREMQEDLAAVASFRRSHPLDFNLLNDDEQPTLYIDDDPAGHNLYLELINAAHQDIALSGLGAVAPSADNHHFELRFRAGTLADVCLDVSQKDQLVALAADDWGMSAPQKNGQSVSFFIGSQKDRTLGQGAKLPLTLQRVVADGDGGSRGTRVELRYQGLTYAGKTAPVSGQRVRHLNIVNHRGQKNIPLHVGFLGPNTVLNDQGVSESNLVLQITNLLKDDDVQLTPESESVNPTRLVISFDHEPQAAAPWQKPWALGTAQDLKDVAIPALADWKVEQEGEQGISTELILTPKTKTTLAAKETVQIPLNHVRSSLPTGHANLYLHYENIPGYWDGQFVCTVEKAPLVYRDGRVGVGTPNPRNPLAIRGVGDWEETLSFEDRDGKTRWHVNQNIGGKNPGLNFVETGVADARLFLQAGGNVGIGTTNPGERLEVNGNIKLTRRGKGIQFIDDRTAENVITKGTVEAESYVAMRIGFPGQAFGGRLVLGRWSTSDPPVFKELMRVGSDGNVGIGTPSPVARLQVLNANQDANGNTLILGPTDQSNLRLGYHQNYSWVQSHGLKPLAINPLGNNVGVGTTDPSQKLTVAGGHLQIDLNRVIGQNPNDKFTYDGKSMGHYSIGWFNDSWFQWGGTTWISGYGGFKFFTNGSPKLTMDYHGNIRYTTSLEKNSSREIKDNIVELPTQEAFTTLAGLNPVKYSLKADEQNRAQLGFIAEEVPDLIASQDGKAINPDNIVAVLTRVVKEQQQMIQALEKKVNALIEK